MILEVETLSAEGTMLRRLAHVTLTSLAMPESVGCIVCW